MGCVARLLSLRASLCRAMYSSYSSSPGAPSSSASAAFETQTTAGSIGGHTESRASEMEGGPLTGNALRRHDHGTLSGTAGVGAPSASSGRKEMAVCRKWCNRASTGRRDEGKADQDLETSVSGELVRHSQELHPQPRLVPCGGCQNQLNTEYSPTTSLEPLAVALRREAQIQGIRCIYQRRRRSCVQNRLVVDAQVAVGVRDGQGLG